MQRLSRWGAVVGVLGLTMLAGACGQPPAAADTTPSRAAPSVATALPTAGPPTEPPVPPSDNVPIGSTRAASQPSLTVEPSPVASVDIAPSASASAPDTTPWTPTTAGTSRQLFAVDFADLHTGWAAGENGTIVHTADGGTTWTQQVSGTQAWLFALHFTDSRTGWAVGGPLNDPAPEQQDQGGMILHTADGGQHWTRQVSGTTAGLNDVYFVDANNGWAVGGLNNETPGMQSGIILRTADGGATWTIQLAIMGRRFSAVQFVDVHTGWATANGGSAVVLKTTDGGTTWRLAAGDRVGNRSASIPGFTALFDIQFVDSTTGWAVGYDGIVHTTDGGATWSQQGRDYVAYGLLKVHFADATRGWVIRGSVDGSAIFHTTDGGATWAAQPVEMEAEFAPNAMAFADATIGWVVGSSTTPDGMVSDLILTNTAGSNR